MPNKCSGDNRVTLGTAPEHVDTLTSANENLTNNLSQTVTSVFHMQNSVLSMSSISSYSSFHNERAAACVNTPRLVPQHTATNITHNFTPQRGVYDPIHPGPVIMGPLSKHQSAIIR